MNQIKKYTETIFENIKHTDENGIEYWEARELQKILEYKEWRNFNKVLQKAITACSLSNFDVNEQFVEVNNPIKAVMVIYNMLKIINLLVMLVI